MQLDVRLRKLATFLTKWQVRGGVFKERGCCLLVAPLSELLVVFEPYITPPGRKVRQHRGLVVDNTNKKFDKHPHCPSLLDFLSGCLVRVLWTCLSSTDPARDVKQIATCHRACLFLIKTAVTIATRVLSCGRIANLFPGLCSSVAQQISAAIDILSLRH